MDIKKLTEIYKDTSLESDNSILTYCEIDDCIEESFRLFIFTGYDKWWLCKSHATEFYTLRQESGYYL